MSQIAQSVSVSVVKQAVTTNRFMMIGRVLDTVCNKHVCSFWHNNYATLIAFSMYPIHCVE